MRCVHTESGNYYWSSQERANMQLSLSLTSTSARQFRSGLQTLHYSLSPLFLDCRLHFHGKEKRTELVCACQKTSGGVKSRTRKTFGSCAGNNGGKFCARRQKESHTYANPLGPLARAHHCYCHHISNGT